MVIVCCGQLSVLKFCWHISVPVGPGIEASQKANRTQHTLQSTEYIVGPLFPSFILSLKVILINLD